MIHFIEELLDQQKLSKKTRACLTKILSGNDKADQYMANLTEREKEQLKNVIAQWLNMWLTKQAELEILYAKTGGEKSNDVTYYTNRSNIQYFVKTYLLKYRTMPGVSVIAEGTGLSRQTVRKHVTNSENDQNEMFGNFDLITKDIVGTIAGVALGQEDVRAAKTYIDVVDKLKKGRPKPSQVRLNNFVITQQMMEELSPEQQAGIMNIISERHEGAAVAVEVRGEVQGVIEEVEEMIPIEEAMEKFEPVVINDGGPTLFE